MANPSAIPARLTIEAETPFDRAAAECVVARAFGPGRYAKTAARLREGAEPVAAVVARDGRAVVGSLRLWPIRIGGAPALFLGPIAVDVDHRCGGTGAQLVEAALADVDRDAFAGVLLVGDMGFFGRLGFSVAEGPAMPGPVNARRLLWLGFGGSPPPVGAVERA